MRRLLFYCLILFFTFSACTVEQTPISENVKGDSAAQLPKPKAKFSNIKSTSQIPIPTLHHFCDLEVELNPTWELGMGRAGKRRIIPIIGGKVLGENVNGKILNVGADWQTILPDGTAELVARYAFETHDGAIIEIVNFGYRHGSKDVIAAIANGEEVSPSEYYMRTQARLETGDPRYNWVNNKLFVGSGGKVKDKVWISLYEIR